MKEKLKSRIYQEGIECFPAWWVILENLGFILNWGIGFFLLMPFKYNGIPIVSWIYLAVLIVFQILLKKHNCSTCYYYGKWCHLGWGKLANCMFKPNSGSHETGMKLSISYILQLPVILIGGLIAGFLHGFTTSRQIKPASELRNCWTFWNWRKNALR